MEHFLSLTVSGDIKSTDCVRLSDSIHRLAGIESVEIRPKENHIYVEGADLDVVEITDKIEALGYSVLTA